MEELSLMTVEAVPLKSSYTSTKGELMWYLANLVVTKLVFQFVLDLLYSSFNLELAHCH